MFKITTTGLREAIIRYSRMSQNLRPQIQSWLEQDGRQLLDDIIFKRFKDQGDGYRKWQKLSEWTENDRERLGFSRSRPILIRTEGFMSSLMGKSNKPVRTSSVGMSVGAFIPNKMGYALNFGSNKKGKNIPARKFMSMTKGDSKEIEEWFHKFFTKEVIGGIV